MCKYEQPSFFRLSLQMHFHRNCIYYSSILYSSIIILLLFLIWLNPSSCLRLFMIWCHLYKIGCIIMDKYEQNLNRCYTHLLLKRFYFVFRNRKSTTQSMELMEKSMKQISYHIYQNWKQNYSAKKCNKLTKPYSFQHSTLGHWY